MRRWARWISILVLTLTLIVSAKPVPETILQLFEAGELKEAEKRLRLEMKGLSDAEKAPLARVLADVLFEQNRLEDSLDWHREVYRHHPDAQIAGLSLCYVGEIYVILGRRQDAEQSFRQLLAESPDSVAGLRATEGLADLAMEVGRLDEAEKLLDSAAIGWERIGDKAAWAENLAQKAQLLLRRTEYELALGAAERSVAVMPSAGGLTVRAQAYHAQLKFDEAIACYEEALAFSEQRFGKSSKSMS